MKNKRLIFILLATACTILSACKKETIDVKTVSLDHKTLDLYIGDEVTLKATIDPKDADIKKVQKWTSVHEEIATVDKNGKVTAIKEGSTTIVAWTGKDDKEKTARCLVNVYPVGAIINIGLDRSEFRLHAGEQDKLTLTIYPEEAEEQVVVWRSSDTDVATVLGDGTVNGLSAGRAVITAKVAGMIRECEVTVLPNIYVAGWEVNSSGKSVAKYWRNGSEVVLSNGSNDAKANSMFVTKNDIHVVGYEVNGDKTVAKHWVNGVGSELPSVNNKAYATSVYVSGNDVYIAGYEIDGSSKHIAQYWLNGVATILGSDSDVATSIFVSDNNVYVSGYGKSDLKPKYWENGTKVTLPVESSKGAANSIFVVDSDVYATGYCGDVNNSAVTWKNDVATILTDSGRDATGNSVAVYNDHVYVAGYEVGGSGKKIAKYWRDGSQSILTDGKSDAEATSVVVVGGFVCVAGYDGNVATYWVDGFRSDLTKGKSKAVANSIFTSNR